MGVAARDGIAFEDNRVVSAAAHARRGLVQDESLAQKALLFGVDDNEAVVAALVRRSLHDLGDSRFFFEVAHSLSRQRVASASLAQSYQYTLQRFSVYSCRFTLSGREGC